MAKQMSRAQRIVLREMDAAGGFDGYCELMLQTGCTSYKAVDWVLDALLRRGYISNAGSDLEVTDAGREALRA